MRRSTPFLLLALLVAWLASAPSAAAQGPVAAALERRVALVIGNSAYDKVALRNPRNDAAAVATALRELGFEVIAGALDLDQEGMKAALDRFERALEGAAVGLFYYAGHGIQADGQNYLLPVDIKMRNAGDLDVATSLDRVQALLEQQQRTNILIVDACRDNPLAERIAAVGIARSRSLQRSNGGVGLAPGRGGAGTLIAYATSPGDVAADGEGKHSPYTAALLEHLPTPGLEVEDVFKRVAGSVRAATEGQQRPWFHTSLTERFFFRPSQAVAEAPADPEAELWQQASARDVPELFLAYLRLYTDGRHVEEASVGSRRLSSAPVEAESPDAPKAPDGLDVAAAKLVASMPAIGRLVTGGFTYGRTRFPTPCGRALADEVGAALGGSVVTGRSAEDVLRRAAAGPDAPLGLPASDRDWLLEGRYAPASPGVGGGALDLTFELIGRSGSFRSEPVRVVPERGSPCRDEVPPAGSPLTEDERRGALTLELASPRGRSPVYEIKEEPERIELEVRLSEPAALWCFDRDEEGRIQKLLPNVWRPEPVVEAGTPLVIPSDLQLDPPVSWKARTPLLEIIKCFAVDPQARLPAAVADTSAPPRAIPGLDDEDLLRAFRDSGATRLAEASVVLAVLPE